MSEVTMKDTTLTTDVQDYLDGEEHTEEWDADLLLQRCLVAVKAAQYEAQIVAAERDALARQVRAVEAWLRAVEASRTERDVSVLHDGSGTLIAWEQPGGDDEARQRGEHVVKAPSLPALGQRLIEEGYGDGE